MNEIKKIHLGHQPFTISVDAHKTLRAYLDAIERQAGEKSDLVKEVEVRMAELLIEERGIKGDKVVLPDDVAFLKEQLGDPGDFKDEEAGEAPHHEAAQAPQRRLFRDTQHALLAGVCSGIAAFIGIDATIVRLLFILALFFGGAAIPLYIVLWLVMPEAKTPSERLQMQGKAVTVDSLKDLVDRADVKGAANRAGKTAGPILERFVQIVSTVIGAGFIAMAVTMFAALTTAVTYLFFHHRTLVAGVIPFPVGQSETIFTVMGAVVAGIASLIALLIGVAMVRRKWVLPGWITASLIGLLLIAGAVGTAVGPDTVTNVRHRYEAAQHLNIHGVDKFTSVEITGDNVDFVYEYSSDYQVGTRYLGNGNPGQVKYHVDKGVLKIDAAGMHRHCDGFCVATGQIDEVVIRAPQLTSITDSQGNRLSGKWGPDMMPPVPMIPSGQHFTTDGYY